MSELYSPHWEKSKIREDATIRIALEAISTSGSLMACVVDQADRILGIMTDSDIRKMLLEGHNTDNFIGENFNKHPTIGNINSSLQELLNLCFEKGVREVPLCTDDGNLQDIFVLGRISSSGIDTRYSPRLPNAMFISAGGKGMRLKSLVSDRPKPLAVVGGKPIIETIISRAAECGIKKFYVSVNYMAEMISDHLRLTQYEDLDINIIRENFPLGTAGALSHIRGSVEHPILLTNGDILTNVSYSKILKSHETSGADITVVVRPFKSEVPFGVVNIVGGSIVGLSEKPSFNYLVNAGIYAINPTILNILEPNKSLDMPDLIEKVIRNGGSVIPFFLHEYWMDIGRPDDFIKANQEYDEHFGAI